MTLHVLFCANTEYFQHVAVACASLASTSAHRQHIVIHLVTCDNDDKVEAMLRDSLARYDAMSLVLYRVSDTPLARFFVDSYLTRECYLRLLAPDILPLNVTRVLYLDCDVVVREDVGPLMALDMRGRAVGAVPDYPKVPYVVASERLVMLGIPEGHVYVNSGVLLMDLNVWRRLQLSRRLVEFVEAQGARLAFHDQDAINAVLFDEIALLDCRWNLQTRMYRCGRRVHPEEYSATREARLRPAILHYVGKDKPWLFRSSTACKGDYFRYLSKTAWRDARPLLVSPWHRGEYGIDRVLSRLGIDYLHVLSKIRRMPSRLVSLAVGRFSRRGLPPQDLEDAAPLADTR